MSALSFVLKSVPDGNFKGDFMHEVGFLDDKSRHFQARLLSCWDMYLCVYAYVA